MARSTEPNSRVRPRLRARVSIDELIGAPPSFDPRVRGEAVRHEGMTLWPLTREGHGAGLTAYKVQISARRRKPPAELGVHAGSDWL
jgi:hypothetical protein